MREKVKLFYSFLFFSFLLIPVFLNGKDFTIGNPNQSLFYGVFQGFGCEWDPWFFNDNNRNAGCNDTHWTFVTNRIKEVNMSLVRIMMQLKWCQSDPNLTQWNFNTTMMQSLYRYLDFCQQNDIHVILTDWGWAIHPNNADNCKLYSSATDTRFTDGIAYYLHELIVNRGYTCIKYVDIGNEPDNEIIQWYGESAFQQMYRNLHNSLVNKGIRNLVKLIGPETGGVWDVTKNFMQNCNDFAEGYCHHTQYAFPESNGGYWTYFRRTDLVRTWQLQNDPQGTNKVCFISEMGMAECNSTFSHCMMDTFQYAIAMADYCTALMNCRLQGGSAWCMFDIIYFNSGGSLMQYGMWKDVTRNWQLRPWSQTYALVVKFAPRGSIQAPVNNIPGSGGDWGDAPVVPRCAALKRPDNGWSIFLTNTSSQQQTANIILPSMPANDFKKYFVNPQTLLQYPTTFLIPPQGTVPKAQTISLTLPPTSFTVLVEDTSGGSSDTTPPGKVNNLQTGNPTQTSITLTWTAPGDDGNTGTATEYDIRYALSAITNDTLFNNANQCTGEPAPKSAGQTETFVVNNLAPGTTYYFALKTRDEANNWSEISNSPSGVTQGVPVTPTITVLSPNGGETWTGNTTRTVTWTWTGAVSNLTIEISTNTGNNWSILAVNTPNYGSQTITVPNTPSNSCRVRVRETDGTPSDISDNNFTIVAGSAGNPVLSVNVSSLDFGEIPVGKTKSLEFTIENTGGGTLTGTITAGEQWLIVTPDSFNTTPVTVNVTVDNEVLAQKEGVMISTVTVISNGGSVDIPVTFTATCVLVKPNPYVVDTGELVFYGSGIIPEKTKIIIWTVSGEKIIELSKVVNGEIRWNGKDVKNRRVPAGVYLYTYESPVEKGVSKFTIK